MPGTRSIGKDFVIVTHTGVVPMAQDVTVTERDEAAARGFGGLSRPAVAGCTEQHPQEGQRTQKGPRDRGRLPGGSEQHQS